MQLRLFSSCKLPTPDGSSSWMQLLYFISSLLAIFTLLFLHISPPTAVQTLHLTATTTRKTSFPQGALALECTKLERWWGRLGNNMLSIIHAALDAKVRGLEFVIKNCTHDMLDLSPFQNTTAQIIHTINPKDAFYIYFIKYPVAPPVDGAQHFLPLSAPCHRQEIVQPLLHHLAVKPRLHDENSLVIAIRSGDIFRTDIHVHPKYSPPPLAFYTDIIDNRTDASSKIVIVTQLENLSPVAQKLLDMYPNRTVLQAGTLEEDVRTILRAKKLVVSPSTFAWSIGLASKDLESLYTFNNGLLVLDDHAFLDTVDVVQYYVINGTYLEEWNYSPEQMHLVMNFPTARLKSKEFTKLVTAHRSYTLC